MTYRIPEVTSLAAGWLLVVVAIILLAASRGLAFDSSILALLPETEQQPLLQQAGDKISAEFSARLLILVNGEDDEDTRAAVTAMAAGLEGLSAVETVTWRIESGEIEAMRDELFAYRFTVLEAGVRQLLLADQHQKISRQALLNLFGPVSAGANTIIDDPFGLYLALQKNSGGNLNLELADSLLRVSNAEQPTYLITVALNGDPFSPSLQQILLTRIEQQRAQLAAGSSIRLSGMLIHAAAGAKQAQAEISTIGLGSLILIEPSPSSSPPKR